MSLPDPLHPAIVHLPLALAALMPLAAATLAVAVWRRWLPPRSWALVMLLQAALVGGAWLAVETGENEEERVEVVVPERFLETHEERANNFLWIATAGLVITGIGLLRGSTGAFGRAVAVAAALGVLFAAIRVGESGGELVYRHGAANAYTEGGRAPSPGGERP